MPRCEVKWLTGRTIDQQNEIAKKLTGAFVDVLGCPPEHVTVVFRETNPAAYYEGGLSVAQKIAAEKKQ